MREIPIVSSLRDSICVKSYPALPCRATDCPVPSGLIPTSNLRFFFHPLSPYPSKSEFSRRLFSPSWFQRDTKLSFSATLFAVQPHSTVPDEGQSRCRPLGQGSSRASSSEASSHSSESPISRSSSSASRRGLSRASRAGSGTSSRSLTTVAPAMSAIFEPTTPAGSDTLSEFLL